MLEFASRSTRRSPMRWPSLILGYLCLMILVNEGSGLPFTIDFDALYNLTNRQSNPPPKPCQGDCIADVAKCIVKANFCYIEDKCYEANETRRNDTVSCLQCQPNRNQRNWGFNPFCSSTELCKNLMLVALKTCSNRTIEAFYTDPKEAVLTQYDYASCSRDDSRCQAGFFDIPPRSEPYACCPGFFCPKGQTCLIPCRPGSYCPSELSASNGTCRSRVNCPKEDPEGYDAYGCGGSTFEGFCPAGSFCSSPSTIEPCPNGTKYCPTGVMAPLACPDGFVCREGRARRQRAITNVLLSVICITIALVAIAEISQWILLKTKLFGEHKLVDPPGVSNYFREATDDPRQASPRYIQLHIHLEQAKLRNVTRFDLKKNEGFTGRITAGKLTALMGGSGCGKSSLLETIHGRRRLRSPGSITFADHEPLSNLLTDYVGYVPQADIMHNDLTVFETVYYSARTRRLNDSKQVILNDVCFVLAKLGLGTMHNNFTRTLSGGKITLEEELVQIDCCPSSRSTKTR